MKNFISLILGLLLCVAFSEGLLLRSGGKGGSVSLTKRQAPHETQGLHLGQAMAEACQKGGEEECERVCRLGGHNIGGCKGGTCVCYE